MRTGRAAAGDRARADETTELRQAAQEFESFLLQQLLKQARSASRLLGGDTQPEMPGRDIFESWQDETYASAVSGAGGIGLADLLVQQLQPSVQRARPETGVTPETGATRETAGPAGAPGSESALPPAVPPGSRQPAEED